MKLTIEQALKKGIEAHKAGNLQEADRYYTAILKANPKHPDANHNMGVLAVHVNKAEKSLPFFKTALETNPKTTQFWLSYIEALIKLDRMSDAKASYKLAKSKGLKGDSFNQIKLKLNFTSATVTKPTQKNISLESNILDRLKLEKAIALAHKKLKEGAAGVAEKIYHDILAKFPKNKQAIAGLAKVSNASDGIALKLQNPPQYQQDLLIKIHNQGLFQQVIDKTSQLLLAFPNSHFLHNVKGASYRALGQIDAALDSYKEAILANPDSAESYNNLGNALKDLGKLAEAIEAYKKAISRKPDLISAYNNMGNALKDQGELDEAIEAYNKAVSLKPDLAAAYNNMGVALKDQGKPKDAITAFSKALSIQPGYVECATNLAILLFESKDYEKASTLFSIGDSSINRRYLLKCLYELNEKSKFYEHLDRLIKIGENNCVIGSYSSRAAKRYSKKRKNPFCNEPIKYVKEIDLTKSCDFKSIFVENASSVLNDGEVRHKSQGHLTNGIQTSGNIFTQIGSVSDLWQRIIQTELTNYKNYFSDSAEGFIRDWPSNYRLYGWLVSMKNGGELSAHIHDTGWITGSIYINVPPKSKKDSGNLIVATHDLKYGKANNNEIQSIDVVTGSMCLFPSSLLHHTIPFESTEDRIVLAFDVIPI